MFVMKYFYKFLTILLGIVVSALAFHAGGPGSIPRLGKTSQGKPCFHYRDGFAVLRQDEKEKKEKKLN